MYDEDLDEDEDLDDPEVVAYEAVLADPDWHRTCVYRW